MRGNTLHIFIFVTSMVLTNNLKLWKRLFLFFWLFLLIQEIHAQNDSIAMSQMNKLGVSYASDVNNLAINGKISEFITDENKCSYEVLNEKM